MQMQQPTRPPPIASSALEKSIASASDALLGLPAGRTAIGCSSSRPTTPFPPNMCCCAIISASPSMRRWKRRSQTTSCAGRAPMAAGRWSQDGPFDMSASVKAYFALKMIGHSDRCAAYGARARGDPLPRRRDPQQRLHALHACDVRRHDLAQRAGAADRDHAAADVVAVPSQQDLLLGAHHHRSADDPGDLEAARAQSPGRRHRRVVPAGSEDDRPAGEGAASELGLVHAVQRARPRVARDRAVVSQEAARAGDRARARFHRGAAQRRRRHGRDLSADGQYRDGL